MRFSLFGEEREGTEERREHEFFIFGFENCNLKSFYPKIKLIYGNEQYFHEVMSPFSLSLWLFPIAKPKKRKTENIYNDDGNLSDLFFHAPLDFWISHKFIFMVFHSTQIINFTTYFGNFLYQAHARTFKMSIIFLVTLFFTKRKENKKWGGKVRKTKWKENDCKEEVENTIKYGRIINGTTNVQLDTI